MSIFSCSGVALITPFKDNNEVDYASLDNLINYHLNNNTDSIIICGTTGEAATLDDDEHLEVIKRCIKKVNGKIPVIAGTGSNNTNHAIMMSKEAEKLGADALLLVTPYYNKTTQWGLKKHYKEISKNVNIPILLYNVPSRTGLNMKPETTLDIIKENDNIVGIKEANSDIKQITDLAYLAREENISYDLYSGNDDKVIDVLDKGGIGVISVCANIIPNEVHDMVKSYIDKDYEKANILQEKSKELSSVLFSEVNPIPVKEACYKLGLIRSNKVRLPLVNISDENNKKLIKVLRKNNLI